jgi:hypothetical protein
VRGSIGGGAPRSRWSTFVDEIIVNTIEVDPINHKIYVGIQDGTGTNGPVNTGIRVYSYDPDGRRDRSRLPDHGHHGRPRERRRLPTPRPAGLRHRLFDRIRGTAVLQRTGTSNSVNLFRLDLNRRTTTPRWSAAAFPVNGATARSSTSRSMRAPTWSISRPGARCILSGNGGYDANDNAVWYISASADNGTPTKVTLTGLPGGAAFFGGDMTFDQSTRQIYIESEETGASHR